MSHAIGSISYDAKTNQTYILTDRKKYVHDTNYYNEKVGWLEHTDDPSEDEILDAIQENALNLQYVKNQTRQMCELAISINPATIIYVHEASDELYLMAAKKQPGLLISLQYFMSKDAIIEVIRKNPEYYFVINQTKFPEIYQYGKLKVI